jgi:hypothetical protein
MEYGGVCPACRRNENHAREERQRNEELAREARENALAASLREEIANKELQHDAHVKQVLRKLLDLAVESVEDSKLAEKKVKVVMKSAVFANNVNAFFDEIEANNFLADCYYKLHLGVKPTIEKIESLPPIAVTYLENWVSAHQNKNYAIKIKKLYASYLSKKADEQDKREAAYERERIKNEKKTKELAEESKKHEIASLARSKKLERNKKIRVILLIIIFVPMVMLLLNKFSEYVNENEKKRALERKYKVMRAQEEQRLQEEKEEREATEERKKNHERMKRDIERAMPLPLRSREN